ncbi:MAG: hypothetical protein ACI8PZ_005944 [Myxococcota bacterium]
MEATVRTFRRVCVYCGSSEAAVPVYGAAAYGIGALLAERGIGVVYGGGSVGLMNQVAQGALDRGGEVIGVIPEKLLGLELGRTDLTELVVVTGMHARKLKMADLSDAFIALPGGYGTFEELFEVTTWTQLEYHHKPVGVLDVNGYYSALRAFLQRAAEDGFIRDLHRELILFDDDPSRLLSRLATVELPELARWIDSP